VVSAILITLQCSVVCLCVCLSCHRVSDDFYVCALSILYDASPPVTDISYRPYRFSIYALRVPVLEVSPYGNAYLRLWFNCTAATGGEVGEVFLFLNDETGQSEESFLFTVRAKR
jgi:hypothetical protein